MSEDIRNMQDLYRAIGRIEGNLTGIIKRLDKINGSIDSHQNKIDKLEDDVSNIKGKATILGAIMGFLGGLVIAIASVFYKSKV